MLEAAREAGSVEAGGKLRSRVQIRTIEQLLDGRKPNMPPVHDIISAAAAARRLKVRPLDPTPQEIRESPSFRFSIKGSKDAARQGILPMDEPLLIAPQPSKGRGRSRSA
jgi:hypothetical protein